MCWPAGLRIREVHPAPTTHWPLCARDDNLLIGGAGFGITDWSTKSANFGYVLQRSAWGQGYATEAGRAVSDWALHELGLSQLVAHCEPVHTASRRVLRKLSFEQQEGSVFLPRTNGEIRSYLTFVRQR